ncbi:DUF6602 domain-containing protein [Xanthomonas bonasiae]|uniref:DUF6602 domain-containing protein n=1 Tax=Xanthomonas bonasiae TaxID=2810351 RepID=UPI003877C6C4
MPDRDKVETGFVTDSAGGRSEQIDIVIFDRHFTPISLGRQRHRSVPATAVYAVCESEPHFDKNCFASAGQQHREKEKPRKTGLFLDLFLRDYVS